MIRKCRRGQYPRAPVVAKLPDFVAPPTSLPDEPYDPLNSVVSRAHEVNELRSCVTEAAVSMTISRVRVCGTLVLVVVRGRSAELIALCDTALILRGGGLARCLEGSMSARAALAEDNKFKTSFSRKRFRDLLECPKETLFVLFSRKNVTLHFRNFLSYFYQIQQKYQKIHIKV